MSFHSGFSSFSNLPASMEFFLPFFFVFAVSFALISSVGKSANIDAFKNTTINAIIALVFGFLAAGNSEFVSFFFRNGPTMIKLFVGLFILAFVLQVFGLRLSGGKMKEKMSENREMVIILGGVGLLLLAFVGKFSFAFSTPGIGNTNLFLTLGLLFIILMFIHAFKIGPGDQAPKK